MKYLKALLFSLANSLIFFILTAVILLSYLQRRFPPQMVDPRPMFSSVKSILEMSSSHDIANGKINPEEFEIERKKLLQELNKISPKTFQGNELESISIKKSVPTVSGNDWDSNRVRWEQTEYKLRALEVEVKLLKSEIKKWNSQNGLKSSL